MPLFCETGNFPAVCAGEAAMERIDRDTLELACDLAPLIAEMQEEGEITLRVQNRWVSCISSLRTKFRKKPKKSV